MFGRPPPGGHFFLPKPHKMNDKQQLQAKKEAMYIANLRDKYSTGNLKSKYIRQATTLRNISYGPQVISLLTAIYAVYYFASLYNGVKFYFLLILGGVILGALELAKRELAAMTWKGKFYTQEREKVMWAVPLALLIALSFAISYTGGDKFVQQESAAPVASYDAQRDSINRQIAEARDQIAVMKQQTWKGVIVRDARATISQLEKRINALTDQRLKLENRDLAATDKAEAQHEARVTSLGIYFGFAAGLMDILLILFFFFSERADWNAHLLANGTERMERNGTDKIKKVSKLTQPVPSVERTRIRAFQKENGTDNRTCANCGTDISHRDTKAKYCSPSCRKQAYMKKNK